MLPHYLNVSTSEMIPYTAAVDTERHSVENEGHQSFHDEGHFDHRIFKVNVQHEAEPKKVAIA
jgi:hypothetical protein